MKISNKQGSQLQEKLAKNNNPEETAKIAQECGIDVSVEEMEQIMNKVSSDEQELSDDELETVSGGIEIGDDFPHYQDIKEYYLEKGANLAFIFCIYFVPSPSCYDMIKLFEEELAEEAAIESRR